MGIANKILSISILSEIGGGKFEWHMVEDVIGIGIMGKITIKLRC